MSVFEKFTSIEYPIFESVRTLPAETPEDVRSLRAQAVKVLEEASELSEAAKALVKADGTESGPAARSAMLAEMADVTQALVNLKYGFNVTDKELAEAAWDCWERNKERGRW